MPSQTSAMRTKCFGCWRAWYYVRAFGDLLDQHRSTIKETVVWNIEEGLKLDDARIQQAEQKRAALDRRLRTFMDTYEFLILPVSQVPPFDVTQRYVTEINGVQMETYIDWMRSCYYISATGLPAISVPCGFTPGGLPVGVQIVGRPHDDSACSSSPTPSNRQRKRGNADRAFRSKNVGQVQGTKYKEQSTRYKVLCKV